MAPPDAIGEPREREELMGFDLAAACRYGAVAAAFGLCLATGIPARADGGGG